ncbi:MAG: phage major capsid protein [Kordiimonadaceae bacterium]|nr:phage major capsid protein [Kordiimonadaceae bacterium]
MPEDMNGSFNEALQEVKTEVLGAYNDLDKKTADLGEVIDVLQEKSANKEDLTDIKSTLKTIQDAVQKGADRADEIERKANQLRNGTAVNAEDIKSASQKFVDSDEYKQLVQKRSGSTGEVEIKSITTPASTGPRNPLESVQSVQGLIVEPDRPLMVRDLIPVMTTSSQLISYAREDVNTDNAGMVAEGAQMAESAVSFTASETPVRTIGHFMHASDQILSDVAMLQSHIGGRLRIGLDQEEETQLMLGDGTGQNLNGLVPQATDYVVTGIPGGALANLVDEVRWAKLQVRKSFYAATAVVLNPVDFAKIELLKDGDGKYLYSAFQSGTELRLWGLRVAESDSIAENEFMVGAFATAAEIWDRQQASVEMSDSDRDNFIKGMWTLRARKRLALAVYRPKSFVHGTFGLAV